MMDDVIAALDRSLDWDSRIPIASEYFRVFDWLGDGWWDGDGDWHQRRWLLVWNNGHVEGRKGEKVAFILRRADYPNADELIREADYRFRELRDGR